MFWRASKCAKTRPGAIASTLHLKRSSSSTGKRRGAGAALTGAIYPPAREPSRLFRAARGTMGVTHWCQAWKAAGREPSCPTPPSAVGTRKPAAARVGPGALRLGLHPARCKAAATASSSSSSSGCSFRRGKGGESGLLATGEFYTYTHPLPVQEGEGEGPRRGRALRGEGREGGGSRFCRGAPVHFDSTSASRGTLP